MSDEERQLRMSLGITSKLWREVRYAAHDCHLDPKLYCRLMVLAAAGMGGAKEHLERAIDASLDADFHLTQKRRGKP